MSPTVFTIAQALTRISNLEQPIWSSTITADQQLQAVNSSLEKIWTYGEWDGLLNAITGMATTNGILTLNGAYRLLQGLTVIYPNPTPNVGGSDPVSIKSQQWQYAPSQNGINWTQQAGPPWYAFDLGDNISGTASQRQYQIAGVPSYIDTLSFNGIAKLRYIYATVTTQIVIPDSYEGLVMALRSQHSYAVGDTTRAEEEFSAALQIVEHDLGQVIEKEDMGRMTVDFCCSGGSIPNLF